MGRGGGVRGEEVARALFAFFGGVLGGSLFSLWLLLRPRELDPEEFVAGVHEGSARRTERMLKGLAVLALDTGRRIRFPEPRVGVVGSDLERVFIIGSVLA